MQLADNTRLQPHVHARNLRGCGQLADRRLSRPASILDADVTVAEAPPKVGQDAVVGAGRAHEVRVLSVSVLVHRPQHAGAMAVALERVSDEAVALSGP